MKQRKQDVGRAAKRRGQALIKQLAKQGRRPRSLKIRIRMERGGPVIQPLRLTPVKSPIQETLSQVIQLTEIEEQLDFSFVGFLLNFCSNFFTSPAQNDKVILGVNQLTVMNKENVGKRDLTAKNNDDIASPSLIKTKCIYDKTNAEQTSPQDQQLLKLKRQRKKVQQKQQGFNFYLSEL